MQTRSDGFEVEVLPSGVYINGLKYGVHVVGGRVIRVRGRNVQAQGIVTPIKPKEPRRAQTAILISLAAIVIFALCQAFG